VAYAVQELGARRVLFGSDATGRDFGAQLGRVTGAAIPAPARRRILWENARELLEGWEGVR
jgi:predicted TIM-barrel fold metal-dependent hydrolase